MKKIYKFLSIFVVIGVIFMIIPKEVAEGGEGEKVVYLTFDDGPSKENTEKVLWILNKNKVRASFFVVGNSVLKNRDKIKKLHKSKMAIYPHCQVHEYKELYESKATYFNDLSRCETTLKSVLGENYRFNYVRLPGGATNEVSAFNIKKEILLELNNRGIGYIDWNIDSGDAETTMVSTNKLKNNFKRNCGRHRVEVVLMHDTDMKDTTVLTLQNLINIYKEKGYKFKTLNEMSISDKAYLEKIKTVNRQY